MNIQVVCGVYARLLQPQTLCCDSVAWWQWCASNCSIFCTCTQSGSHYNVLHLSGTTNYSSTPCVLEDTHRRHEQMRELLLSLLVCSSSQYNRYWKGSLRM